MLISDPPLIFDLSTIGEKVLYNQYKHESMDGFVKQNEECYIILPSVLKHVSGNWSPDQQPRPSGTSAQNQANSAANSCELVIKPLVLPLNYEFP